MLNSIIIKDRKIYYEKNDLSKLNTPYFLISRSKIKEQYKKIIDGFKNIKIFYSVKSNPNKDVLRFLNELGCGFSVSSIGEFLNIKDVINLNKTIYVDSFLNEDKAKLLLDCGISKFVIDSVEELNILEDLSKANREISVYIRVNTKIKINGRYNVGSTGAFGCSLNTVNKIVSNIVNVKFLGIHNHISSQIEDIGIFRENIKILSNFLRNNKKIKELNLGGGIPIEYEKKVPDIGEIVKVIKDELKGINVDLSIEPGRFIIGPSCILVMKIMSIKERDNLNIAFLDASLYNTNIDRLIADIKLPIFNYKKGNKKYILRGCSVSMDDVFGYTESDLKTGDLVIFYNAGAYTMSTDLLGMKKPMEFIL